MRVVVTANGTGLDAPFVPIFGRSPSFVLVDTETLACESLANDAIGASGGAGIQAAQAVAARGVGAVITGQVGPNAHRVLQAAGVPIYLFSGDTVRQALQAHEAGWLRSASAATAPGHSGLGLARGSGAASRGESGGRHGRGGGGRPHGDVAPPTDQSSSQRDEGLARG